MELRGKAFYNFLKLKHLSHQGIDPETWQVEDMRSLGDEDLFSRLEDFGIQLTKETLELYVEKCDVPEDLADCLLGEGVDDRLYGQVYLLVFEAWRRFYPKKQTLSLLCDELDHLVNLYDEDALDDEDQLFDRLVELSKILDMGVDEGASSIDMFEFVNSFCVTDLETLIYDYCCSLMDHDQRMNASELIDAYHEYVSDKRWLDLLKIRLIAEFDDDETHLMMDRLFNELQHDPDLDLGLEMLRVLMDLDERRAFQMLLDQISVWVETEDDFQQLLCVVRDYFGALDLKEEATLNAILKAREHHCPDAKFFPTDTQLKSLKQMVSTQLAQF